MVKKLFLIFGFCAGLSAQSALEKAQEFISNDKLANSKNLIAFLFSNDAKYYDASGNIDSILILKTLKANNLLELSFKEPQDLEMSFVTSQNPLIFMRVVTESLNAMGYNFFITKRALKTPEEFVWSISLSTQNAPNPLTLNDALKARGCEILNVEKIGYTWAYKIDSKNAKIETIELEIDKKTDLKKPFAPYLLALSDETKTILVEAHQLDHWYPKVSFYDNKLHLIKTTNNGKRESVLKLQIPYGSAYVKIDDKYTLDNIKRGLSVTIGR